MQRLLFAKEHAWSRNVGESQCSRMQRTGGGDGKGESAKRGVRAQGVGVTIDLCHIIRPVVSVMENYSIGYLMIL